MSASFSAMLMAASGGLLLGETYGGTIGAVIGGLAGGLVGWWSARKPQEKAVK